MALSAAEKEYLNSALGSIQADLEAHKVLTSCFLVNLMARTGRMELLDELLAQAVWMVSQRQPVGISAQEAELQRQETLQALERLTDSLQLARAAMERVDDPNVN
ncbi:MAG: hypothetical protein BroJett013_02360 [Alphaproteobacteria bacterium]|nr:MAG: hypothetical protein BroJett013_02360 [Alphaproteobacteria bacterium]